MSWEVRRPGVGEGDRPVNYQITLTAEELEELGLKDQPGAVTCAACGFRLDSHTDTDCIITFQRAVKGLLRKIDDLESRLSDLEELEAAATSYIESPAVVRGNRYQELVAIVNTLRVGGGTGYQEVEDAVQNG